MPSSPSWIATRCSRAAANRRSRSLAALSPRTGAGALPAISDLARLGRETATRSSGPRFFHFVIGGTTPAALAADWLTSTLDQNAGAWVASPLASRLESICIDWLRDLFELPPRVWRRPGDRRDDGQLHLPARSPATGAGSGVGSASPERDWRAPRRSRSSRAGTSTRARPSRSAMLGIGAANVRKLTRDAAGRLDLDALERGLAELEGDPGDRRRQRRRGECGRLRPDRRDGGPGPGARRLAPRRRRLRAVRAAVAEVRPPRRRCRACPVRLLRRPQVAERAPRLRVRLRARAGAPQRNLRRGGGLPSLSGRSPAELGIHGTGGSRRARAFAIWATLRAYGRSGYRQMVERHLELAQHLAARVDAEPELERLAEAPLNIVCFAGVRGGRPRATSTSSTAASVRRCSATAASSPEPPCSRARSRSGPRSSTGGPVPRMWTRWPTSSWSWRTTCARNP